MKRAFQRGIAVRTGWRGLGFVLSASLLATGAGAQPSGPDTPGAPIAAATPAPAVAAADTRQFTLSNGMALIVKVDRRAPIAVNMVWIRAGAMDEVDGTSGIAHMLEHMMFKGTPEVPVGEFSRRVAALGGRENAFTNLDYTGYYQQVPAARLPDVMKLEADRFANNAWPDAEFLKERQVVAEERRMRTEDRPRSRLYEALSAQVWTASPYHRPVVGWMGDIAAFTADDVRDFYRRWYVPANAAIVIAGDVDPEQVRGWAESTYGRIPARAVPARKPRPEPVQVGMRRFDFRAPAEQAYVALAFRAPGLESLEADTPEAQDALALTVLAAVLDGYSGARLQRHLARGENRVADGVDASHALVARGPKLFTLAGVPAKGHSAAELEKALRGEVALIAREGVGEAELRRVKIQWRAGEVFQRDSVFAQAQDLGSNWVQGLPLGADARLLDRLAAVTSAQLQSVAQRYFGDEQLTVGTLVPLPPDPSRPPRPQGDEATGGPVH
ncbi:insulinase family protein [Xylophilus rhododendri]|uniref:Insulinase family protein n=1 Tax=Xylophilus rhododendri TaxID=2697032 RepID=A0A857J9I2_9BURK|nr:pitrilysin family protein [Xylophilus rhododendri]QHI99415.1 insulinase family protein [Xylophilus rhododendri]